MLAGVSVTWYTWLEQGRRINVSTDVLEALARALRLDDAERQHLLTLAVRAPAAHADDVADVPDALTPIVDFRDACMAQSPEERFSVGLEIVLAGVEARLATERIRP